MTQAKTNKDQPGREDNRDKKALTSMEKTEEEEKPTSGAVVKRGKERNKIVHGPAEVGELLLPPLRSALLQSTPLLTTPDTIQVSIDLYHSRQCSDLPASRRASISCAQCAGTRLPARPRRP